MIGLAWAMAPGGTGQPAGGGSILDLFLPFVLIFGIFYFLLIRPQQKQQRKHAEMLGSLQRGDEVVTSGGIHGQIVSVDEPDVVIVQIADKVRIKVSRSAVAAKLEGEKKS